jgi:hypothetical protein
MTTETTEPATFGHHENRTPTVMLRNGASEAEALVATTMMALERLLDGGQGIRFYELVTLCRDPDHVILGNSGEKLAELCLVDLVPGQAPKVHDSIRNIVLSAVHGENASMALRSPLAPKDD